MKPIPLHQGLILCLYNHHLALEPSKTIPTNSGDGEPSSNPKNIPDVAEPGASPVPIKTVEVSSCTPAENPVDTPGPYNL